MLLDDVDDDDDDDKRLSVGSVAHVFVVAEEGERGLSGRGDGQVRQRDRLAGQVVAGARRQRRLQLGHVGDEAGGILTCTRSQSVSQSVIRGAAASQDTQRTTQQATVGDSVGRSVEEERTKVVDDENAIMPVFPLFLLLSAD
jgi:hypothetical protein